MVFRRHLFSFYLTNLLQSWQECHFGDDDKVLTKYDKDDDKVLINSLIFKLRPQTFAHVLKWPMYTMQPDISAPTILLWKATTDDLLKHLTEVGQASPGFKFL